jgi:hypothetical protein
MIAKGRRIVVFNVGEEFNGMYGLGVPSDVDRFLKAGISIPRS